MTFEEYWTKFCDEAFLGGQPKVFELVLKEVAEKAWNEALAQKVIPEDIKLIEGYKIDWTESERGCGQHSDGTSLHLTLEDAMMCIKKHWDREAIVNKSGQALDCYTRPDDPVKCKLNAILVKNIKELNERNETYWVTVSKWWNGIE